MIRLIVSGSFIELQHTFKHCVLCLNLACVCHRFTVGFASPFKLPQNKQQMTEPLCPRRSVPGLLDLPNLFFLFWVCSLWLLLPFRIFNPSRMVVTEISVLLSMGSNPYDKKIFLQSCLSACKPCCFFLWFTFFRDVVFSLDWFCVCKTTQYTEIWGFFQLCYYCLPLSSHLE